MGFALVIRWLLIQERAVVGLWRASRKGAIGGLTVGMGLAKSDHRKGEMFMLSGILRNPFCTRKVSLGNLLRFAGPHLEAMVSRNEDGALTGRIAATSAVLNSVRGGRGDAWVLLAVQMARTQGKRAFRRSLSGELTRIHAGVVAAYGMRSAELTACFPRGRRAFDRCPDAGLGALLGSMAGAVASQAPATGPMVAQRAAELGSTWRALWAEQEEKLAAHQISRFTLRGLRRALEVELNKNVLSLAVQHAEEPELVRRYCPEHLLRNRSRGQEETPEEPAPAEG